MSGPKAFARRIVLGVGAAAVASGAYPAGSRAQTARFRRREISSASTPQSIRDSYKAAVTAMLQLPPTDPRNWYRNAFVHIFDCPHGNWWFLPWHRAYLGWFERTCRALSGDQTFALPYWDWTARPRVPAAMFDGVMDPNHPSFVGAFNAFRAQFEPPFAALWNGFSQPQRVVLAQRGLNAPADFWAAAEGMFFGRPNARGLTASAPGLDSITRTTVALGVIRRALRTATFAGGATGATPAGFASAEAANHSDASRKGILESQPHDNVHGALGGPSGNGFMVSFLSPVDPVFFLHHANLDRLWDVWTRRQTALGRPTLPQGTSLAAWSNERFLFFSDENGQPVSQTGSGDYATPSVFEYDYSPGSGEDQVPASAPAVTSGAPAASRQFSARIADAAIGGRAPAGGMAEVPVAALRAGGSDVVVPVAEVSLDLSHADEGRRFRVLVTPAGSERAIEAGAITVFGHHARTGPITFTVPLPEQVARVARTARGSVALDIRVVPARRTAGAPVARSAPGSGGHGAMVGARPSAPRVTGIQVRTG